MKKLVLFLISILLITSLVMIGYTQDDVTSEESTFLATDDVDATLMSEGYNGKIDGQPIPNKAFRNANQLLIDFTHFQEYVEKSGYYANEDSLRNPAKTPDPYNPAESEVKGDPNDEETAGEEGSLDPYYHITARDMRYQNWVIELNHSADTNENRKAAYCKEIKRKNGELVLGVKILFPNNGQNAWAKIKPPFEIKAYKLPDIDISTYNDPTAYESALNNIRKQTFRVYNPRFKDVGGIPDNHKDKDGNYIYSEFDHAGYGIIDNAGQIKLISMEVYGLQHNIGVSVLLNDQFEEESEYFMGYINFNGWRRIFWRNPNYIGSVDNRDLFKVPLYPVEKPFIRFHAIKVYRPATERVHNFVAYFRNVKVSYDFAVLPQLDYDIDDEAHWQIIRKKYVVRSIREKRKSREIIYLRKQERARLGANEKPKDFVNPNSRW